MIMWWRFSPHLGRNRRNPATTPFLGGLTGKMTGPTPHSFLKWQAAPSLRPMLQWLSSPARWRCGLLYRREKAGDCERLTRILETGAGRPHSGRRCKRYGVSFPIWKTVSIRRMVEIEDKRTVYGNVPIAWFPERTSPACAGCTTGFICRVLKMSRIIYKIRDIQFAESISECILWSHLSGQTLVRIMGRIDTIWLYNLENSTVFWC